MDSGPVERAGRVPVPYRIVVRGQLTERFTEPLEGVVIESAGTRSVLRVEVMDQAKLQGILGWLYEHGVDLVSLGPVDDAVGDGVSPVVKR